MSASDPPIISMRRIHKRFPGVHALRGVDFSVSTGEVVALLGENGAGKSTLIKILGGAHQPDEGEILLDGNPVTLSSPHDSQDAGISVIYQEFNLVPRLSVRENIFLGREPTRRGQIDHRRERNDAANLLERIGLSIDPDCLCGELTVAEQQAVEIAKALSMNARLVIMDEPSAALSPKEVTQLFSVVRELKESGFGVIYISHRLGEIDEICDRIVVLRDGENVGGGKVDELSREELIELMVGRPLESEFPERNATIGEPALTVDGLNRGTKVVDVGFSVRSGEVLGFSGLVGAGRTETMRAVMGVDQRDSGTIQIDGSPARIEHPREAIRQGLCYLSEDRKGDGLVLIHSVVENFALPNLERFSRRGVINRTEENREFGKYVDELRIKISGPNQKAGNLSGGNQQKVVLAKWLARHAKIIIIDEPTRGIDVGAKFEIYQLINELAEAGKAIVIVSSELPEILGMSDRIIVMHEGKIKGEIENPEVTTGEDILKMAISNQN